VSTGSSPRNVRLHGSEHVLSWLIPFSFSASYSFPNSHCAFLPWGSPRSRISTRLVIGFFQVLSLFSQHYRSSKRWCHCRLPRFPLLRSLFPVPSFFSLPPIFAPSGSLNSAVGPTGGFSFGVGIPFSATPLSFPSYRRLYQIALHPPKKTRFPFLDLAAPLNTDQSRFCEFFQLWEPAVTCPGPTPFFFYNPPLGL